MKYLTTAEVAEQLGITRRRVQALIAAGRLAATPIGQAKMVAEKDLASFWPWPKGRPKKNPEKSGK